MKEILLFSAGAAATAAGLIAAGYWFRASQMYVGSNYFEPVDVEAKQIHSTASIISAMKDAARLNKIVARWTALAVLLSALLNVGPYALGRFL